jgi:GNAT superfamily N-acetyltransferase
MTDLDIRPAERGELAAVLALYAELDGPEATLPADRAAALFERLRAAPEQDLYVAADPVGAIVGTFLLVTIAKLSHGGAPAAVVDDVVVAAERQGQGIGRAMMREAMARARQRGCYKLMLSSNRLRTDAHAFYARLGFARHGVSFEVAL